MRTLYLDCFSGASGDMLLGALVELGVPLDDLQQIADGLAVDDVRLVASRVERSGLAATKVDVVVGGRVEGIHGSVHRHGEHAHHHEHPAEHDHDHGDGGRSLPEILALLDRSSLSERTRLQARRAFERLGEAEARAHGTTVDAVHFHEVGAADAIVDVVATCAAVEALGVDRITCSPVNVGGGSVTFSHGTYPVPTPATLELLRGVPIYSGEPQLELVTPTGAALVTTLVDAYGPLPAMRVERIGHGAGTRDTPGRPNVLRAMLGEETAESRAGERVVVVEATIDDMTPEALGYFAERALAEGALDVTFTPVQMKKSRPGVALTLLADPTDFDRLARLVFCETTTLGFRYRESARRVLRRETVVVETAVGPIRVKVGRLDNEIVTVAPEYDDCREAALRTGRPFRDVQALAEAAFDGRYR